MPSSHQSLLCQYRYDALDRLINHAPANEAQHQRFYCKSRLATEIQGALRHSIVQNGELLLAQQQTSGSTLDTTLLATDQQRSVLHVVSKADQKPKSITYSPYGHRGTENGLLSLLGFNGQRPDPITGHYLLGNGYRAFNPVLMRFNSPDSLSPFGKGGLNAYTYCSGDPINLSDPTGHTPGAFGLISTFNQSKKTTTQWLKKTAKRSSTPRIENPQLSAYTKLQNRFTPEDLLSEHVTHKNKEKELGKKLIKTISNSKDFRKLKSNHEYVFVLSDQGKFLIAAPYKATSKSGSVAQLHATSHAVLADLSGANIISAGHIQTKTMPNITIENFSGHFHPPSETLGPAVKLLEQLGANIIEVIRLG
ncbi:RHS repeat-associated core domain-containing protein|uniref:RHS repeat-associated core domain-containing protein n=1 Tax=Pseudomonas sp. SbOxS1 TaxID=2723884 RepID=UPI0015D1768B|nr:RHS repeat-associated core domain-containing protein [Pseudomonas sp. SbOxS1]NYU06778.1 RHS repeat-associated core domain-containing protein [Pseudomonas sp. SbOxS1]